MRFGYVPDVSPGPWKCVCGEVATRHEWLVPSGGAYAAASDPPENVVGEAFYHADGSGHTRMLDS